MRVCSGLPIRTIRRTLTRFLAEGGDPFARIGADRKGRVAIDWGVYGVPETFIVKGDGTIAYRFVGPLSGGAYRETILPEIEKAVGDEAKLKNKTPAHAYACSALSVCL